MPFEHRAGFDCGSLLLTLGLLLSMAVVTEAATINCVSNGADTEETGCFGAVGEYSAGDEVTNTWWFYNSDEFTEENLIYILEISGTSAVTLALSAEDFVTNQDSIEDQLEESFVGAQCIPTFGAGTCGMFLVSLAESIDEELPFGELGYYMTIYWFINDDPLSFPGETDDDPRNVILRAPGGIEGTFSEALRDGTYQPFPSLPNDPALGGRGDTFSLFGGFRTAEVPEPASLVLFGSGLAAALYARRRRR